MSIIGSNALAGASGQAGAAGYEIERSLRFNSGDSAYLSRTPSSAGNRKTWTWSGWIKRSTLTGTQNFFSTNPASGETNTNSFRLRFTSANTLAVLHTSSYSIKKSEGKAGPKGVSKSRQVNPPNLRLTGTMLNSIKADKATNVGVDIIYHIGNNKNFEFIQSTTDNFLH